MAGQQDELGERRSETTLLVCPAHVVDGGKHFRTVGKHGEVRWFVGDEDSYVLGALGQEGECVNGAAAAGKQVHRAANLLDDPMQVLGVDVGRRRWSVGRPLAAL